MRTRKDIQTEHIHFLGFWDRIYGFTNFRGVVGSSCNQLALILWVDFVFIGVLSFTSTSFDILIDNGMIVKHKNSMTTMPTYNFPKVVVF